MSSENTALAEAIQQAIQTIGIEKGDDWVRAITPIVLANLGSGRVQYFLDEQSHHQLDGYVLCVAEKYEQWHDYLNQIQEKRDSDVWDALYEKLQRWAFHQLSRKSFPHNGREKFHHAVECATDASTRLLFARFPYDIDFGPWLSVLLQNVIRKHIEQEYVEAARDSVSIDDGEEWQNISSALTATPSTNQIALRVDLLAAIDHLSSEARKQIIILHYLEGYSLPQIAHKLDKSDSAIYKLHFDALNNLRKIWGSLRDKNE